MELDSSSAVLRQQTGRAASHVPETNRPTITIEAKRGLRSLGLGELSAHRELLYFLAWRDIKVRYKQTLLGVLWAVIQPLATMVVFSVFFGRLGNLPSDGLPYPIFSLTAVVPWQLFHYSLTFSSMSMVTEARLITKVYFPRLVIPLASVLAGLVDFAIAMCVLFVIMAFYGVTPTTNIVLLPLFVGLVVLAALSVGLWLSALNVRYRDVRHAVPFFAQMWLFASPVAYSSNSVPEAWQWLYGLNPMAGVIEGFRWALLGTAPPMATIYVSALCSGAALVGGLYYFRYTEKSFADII